MNGDTSVDRIFSVYVPLFWIPLIDKITTMDKHSTINLINIILVNKN